MIFSFDSTWKCIRVLKCKSIPLIQDVSSQKLIPNSPLTYSGGLSGALPADVNRFLYEGWLKIKAQRGQDTSKAFPPWNIDTSSIASNGYICLTWNPRIRAAI